MLIELELYVNYERKDLIIEYIGNTENISKRENNKCEFIFNTLVLKLCHIFISCFINPHKLQAVYNYQFSTFCPYLQESIMSEVREL